jgi:hypothetical protein
MKPSALLWNAMIQAAKAERDRKLDPENAQSQVPLAYDTLIRNDTGADLPRFAIVGLNGPVTTRAARENTFKNQAGAMKGAAPTNAYRGKFAVLVEPIRNGKVGRALTGGLIVTQVKLLNPTTTDPQWADVDATTAATMLKETVCGGARVLWTEPSADRAVASEPWCIVHIGVGPAPFEEFRCKVHNDGGSAGSSSTSCSFTYTIRTMSGKDVLTAQTPTRRRFTNVEYSATPTNTQGWAYFDENGVLKLSDANELPALTDCGASGVNNLSGGDANGGADTLMVRQDLAATWASVNPTLSSGEIGLETDTNLSKIGDGSTVWNDLPYMQTTPGSKGDITVGGTLSSARQVFTISNSVIVRTHVANGETTPAAYGADQNAVAIGSGVFPYLRVSASAATYKITGFAAPAIAGTILTVVNIGSHPIRFTHQDTGEATAANRIVLPNDLPWCVICPGDTYVFVYDLTTARWRYVSGMDEWFKNRRYCRRWFEDFAGGTAAGAATTGELGWSNAGTGTSGTPTEVADAWGVRFIQTAAVGAERTLYLGGGVGGPFPGLFGSNSLWVWRARVKPVNLPDATNNYYFAAGMSQLLAGLGGTGKFDNSSPGVMFELDRTYASPGNWYISSGNDTPTYTKTDTGVAASAAYTDLLFYLDQVTGRVDARINGAAAGGHTTTLPGATYGMNPGVFHQYRVAGTTARQVHMDTWELLELRRQPT